MMGNDKVQGVIESYVAYIIGVLKCDSCFHTTVLKLVAVFVAYRYRLQKDPEVDPYLLLGGGARVT